MGYRFSTHVVCECDVRCKLGESHVPRSSEGWYKNFNNLDLSFSHHRAAKVRNDNLNLFAVIVECMRLRDWRYECHLEQFWDLGSRNFLRMMRLEDGLHVVVKTALLDDEEHDHSDIKSQEEKETMSPRLQAFQTPLKSSDRSIT